MQGFCSFYLKGQWMDLYLVLDGHLRHLGNRLPLVRDLSVFGSKTMKWAEDLLVLPQRVYTSG